MPRAQNDAVDKLVNLAMDNKTGKTFDEILNEKEICELLYEDNTVVTENTEGLVLLMKMKIP